MCPGFQAPKAAAATKAGRASRGNANAVNNLETPRGILLQQYDVNKQNPTAMAYWITASTTNFSHLLFMKNPIQVLPINPARGLRRTLYEHYLLRPWILQRFFIADGNSLQRVPFRTVLKRATCYTRNYQYLLAGAFRDFGSSAVAGARVWKFIECDRTPGFASSAWRRTSLHAGATIMPALAGLDHGGAESARYPCSVKFSIAASSQLKNASWS